ncbi:MAG: exonuclease subunit SbcD [Spirochaetaceae bacterium]|jgi:exonuclease SbcD|nr:exonuclease subunit SbcD [Spirochaetaceae bacterium]
MAFRFLHTADLHLGRVFHEHPLLEDQAFMLDQLAGVLAGDSYRALVIAGDVYDRSIPSPDAVSLFGGFLGKLKARRPDLEILILPGNHDSASRLGFGKELFAELGIHFVTDPEDADKPVIVRDRDGNTCAFFLLPFLHPGSLSCRDGSLIRPDGSLIRPNGGPIRRDGDLGYHEGGPRAENTGADEGSGEAPADRVFLRSQARLAEEAATRLEKARQEALENGAGYTVLAAHLFASGGAESDSERVFLGSAERVDAGLFASFDYAALGHLHRFQKAGGNCWYSGSPLAYSFDEAEKSEKCFLSVELGDSVTVTPVPVKPLRGLRRLRGDFSRFFRDSSDPVLKEAENDYLEIILGDSSLVENPLPLLRRRFPWILSVKQEEALAVLRGNFPALSRTAEYGQERRGPVEDFEDFLSDIYGDPEEAGLEDLARENREKIGLFRELLAEIEAAP